MRIRARHALFALACLGAAIPLPDPRPRAEEATRSEAELAAAATHACEAGAPERKPFRHLGDHVRSAWNEPSDREHFRDCTGCHVYPGQAQRIDPQERCLLCHYGDSMAIAATDPRFEKNLDAARRPRSTYDHYDHRTMTCRACHLPKRAGDEPVIRTGTRECLDCHDPARPTAMNEAKLKVYGMVASLNTSPALKEPEPAARFRHDEHLTPAQLRDPRACLACHAPVAKARSADLGAHEFDLADCARCHRDQAGAGVRFGETQVAIASRADGTFPHDRHLSPEALKAEPKLRDSGCLACHETGATRYGQPGFGTREFEGDYYQTCIGCHFHRGDADKKVIRDHGTVDGCMDCHAIGGGAMKTNRPVAQVSRPRARRYEVRTQAHPHITGDAVGADCSKCHRAAVPALPSRVGLKTFSHDTHLARMPSGADCTACHTKVAATAGPEAAAAEFYVPDAKVCASCHLGDVPRPVEEPAAPREVPRFPHAKHLSADALANDPSGELRAKGCVACHEPAQAGNPDVGTTDAARACTKCHDHEKAPKITGGKDRAYVSQCGSCHAIGVPNKGFEIRDTRRVLEGRLSPQWHPRDTACKDCHAVDLPSDIRPPRAVADARVLGEFRATSPHKDRGTPPVSEKACSACHWADAWLNSKSRPYSDESNRPLTRPMLLQLGDDKDYPGRRR